MSGLVKRKKNGNLKQIFILSLDSLRERKLRSALTILMVASTLHGRIRAPMGIVSSKVLFRFQHLLSLYGYCCWYL
jgi:hypothetical protein